MARVRSKNVLLKVSISMVSENIIKFIDGCYHFGTSLTCHNNIYNLYMYIYKNMKKVSLRLLKNWL